MQENKKSITKKPMPLKRRKLPTRPIDDLEIPETDENFWAAADIHVPRRKEMITLRWIQKLSNILKVTAMVIKPK